MRFASRYLSLVVSLCCGTSFPLFAQHQELLRGRVVSALDSSALSGAAIVVLEGSHPFGTRAGPTGAFRVALTGPARIVAAQLGYRPETLSVAGPKQPVTFRLVPAPLALDPVLVQGSLGRSASSSTVIGQLDLALRPQESSQDLLRFVPGLVLAQHQGGGKAEQTFLRGFDADHGTDVAISVDGTPANMVSHAHGQGYADLHFLIPELVDRIDVRKGPYDPADGDLATAGAVAFTTKDRVPTTLDARAGSFETGHALALLPVGGDASRPYVSQQNLLDATQPNGRRYYWKSEYLPALGADLLRKVSEHAAHIVSPHSAVVLFPVDGALNRFPEDHSPAGNRDARMVLNVTAAWDRAEDDQANIEWARAAWRDMRRFSTGGTYVNFLTEEEGEDRTRAAYGRNYARLVDVKTALDPNNLFRMNKNIQPTGA